MNEIAFTKYEALRNDFIIVHQPPPGFRWTATRVAAICDRRAGAGADGLIILGAPKGMSASFRLFNADGGSAEWSGNGIRCAIACLQDTNAVTEMNFKTAAGPINATIEPRGWRERWASFERPLPEVRLAKMNSRSAIPLIAGPFHVDAGNPHRVYIVKDFGFDWEDVGAKCQDSARRTRGINVEFVRLAGLARLEMRLYERGVGPTPASGSGALAAVTVCHAQGEIGAKGIAASVGGLQSYEIDDKRGSIRLHAPVRHVYSGQWSPNVR
ncbi:MAG: diaminopimelate epimerase [Candidatus Zixiibacteriota bacterium]